MKKVIILLIALSSCDIKEIRKESTQKVRLVHGDIRTAVIDSCEYIIADNGYKGGICIIHKVNCKNHK